LILNGFNYETAQNTGVELSATYKDGNFSASGNLAWARQVAKNVVTSLVYSNRRHRTMPSGSQQRRMARPGR
jgi:hypothetical protein